MSQDLCDVQRQFVLRKFDAVLRSVAEALSGRELGLVADDRAASLSNDCFIPYESSLWESSAPWVVLALQSLFETGRCSSILPYLRARALNCDHHDWDRPSCVHLETGSTYADPGCVPMAVVYTG